MSKTLLAEWLDRLERQHPFEIDLGLERVAKVWSRLQLEGYRQPLQPPVTISVAGTNGKGSCVAAMEAVLLAHGVSVGAFTSPHFLRYNERIRVAGHPVDDALIIKAFECIDQVRGSISLSYFEYGTLAALWIFADQSVKVRLLEVGLGGRLDAVNIIDADVSVITSIALDHQQWLGETVTEIAKEKLGIARAHRPLVWGERAVSLDFQKLIGGTMAEPQFLGRDYDAQLTGESATISVGTVLGRTEVPDITGDLTLVESRAMALQALAVADIPLDVGRCQRAINTLSMLGRFQRTTFRGIPVILDVAHNPAAAKLLSDRLSGLGGTFLAVASVLQDKDWAGIVASLATQITRWHLAKIASEARAADAHSLLQVVYNEGLAGISYEHISDAFLSAIDQAVEGESVVVLGSFHTVADVLKVMDSGEHVG